MFEAVKYLNSGKFLSRGEWIHPDRIIDSLEIMFVIDGIVYINENGTEYVLRKNDVIILEPDLRHFGYKKSSNTSFYWLHVTNSTVQLENKVVHIHNPYNLSLLFNQLLHYSVDASLPECTDYIARLILAEVLTTNIKQSENKLANNIADWIVSNNDIMLKVSDISQHFGYNVDYISRLFKKNYNKSLKEYIDNVKIQFIKNQILNSNTSLKEIATECGFEEYGYFLKFFKYHEGITPTQFYNIYSKTHTNNR